MGDISGEMWEYIAVYVVQDPFFRPEFIRFNASNHCPYREKHVQIINCKKTQESVYSFQSGVLLLSLKMINTL